jgi:hypothetical protein
MFSKGERWYGNWYLYVKLVDVHIYTIRVHDVIIHDEH